MIYYILFKLRKKTPLFIRKNLRGSIIYFKDKLNRFKFYSDIIEKGEKNREVVLFKQFIKSGTTVIDVGANIGNMTDIFLECGAKKVIAVEPHPECIKILKKRFSGLPVLVIGKGAGSQKEKKKFYLSKGGSATSTYADSWINERFKDLSYSPIDSDIVTLSDLIKEHGKPSFCKIDVEGFEKEVLKGLKKEYVPFIFFEFTFGFLNDLKDCLDILSKNHEYLCNYSFENTGKLESKKWITSDQLIEKLGSYDERRYIGGDVCIKLKK